jgi:hypothetical protein
MIQVIACNIYVFILVIFFSRQKQFSCVILLIDILNLFKNKYWTTRFILLYFVFLSDVQLQETKLAQGYIIAAES